MSKPFAAMEPAAVPPKKSKAAGCAVLLGLAGILITAFAIFGPSQEEIQANKRREAAQVAAAEARCKADLNCLGEKYLISANSECRAPIERFARYDIRWDKSIFEARFSHYRWKDQARGVVTFVGDRISFQNGFGAWQPHTYECDFDTNSRTAIAARVTPGRL